MSIWAMARGMASRAERANDAVQIRTKHALAIAAATLTALALSLALGTPAHAVLVRTPAGHTVSFQPTVARTAAARALRSLGLASIRGRRPAGAGGTSTAAGATSASAAAGAYQPCTTAESACLRYYGGPAMRTTTLTPIFWNPSGLGLSYPSEYEKEVEQFFVDLAADSGKRSNFFSVLTQYSDSSGAISYSVTSNPGLKDTDALPTGTEDLCTSPWSSSRPCVTDQGLRTELKALIAREGLATGLGHEYVVFFPPGMDSCFGAGGSGSTECSGTGYCGYHTTVTVSTSSVQYANEPDNGDPEFGANCTSDKSLTAANLTVDTASHEISESVTDPEVETKLAWYDEHIANTTLGEVEYGEIGDICSWEFKQGDEPLAWVNGSDAASTSDQTIDGHPYLLQTEWDNAHSTCSISAEAAAAAAPATPPTASFFTSSTKVLTNVPVSVDGSASTGTIASYEWSWGDGSAPQSSSSPTAAHEYSTTEGTPTKTFTVTLTVTDAKGEKASISKPVEVEDRKPSASFASPSDPLEGQPVAFDGSSSNDPDGTIASYHWTFGDGESATGPTPSHTYATAGAYTVTLTVTDNAGQTAQMSHEVIVGEVTREPTSTPTPTPTSTPSPTSSTSGTSSSTSSLTSTINASGPLVRLQQPVAAASSGGAPAPNNRITVIAVKQNRRTGSVSLVVDVPGAGTLALAPRPMQAHEKRGTKPLVHAERLNIASAGATPLHVIPTTAARTALAHSHRFLVKVLITFSPVGGTPRTIARSVVLRLGARHRHR